MRKILCFVLLISSLNFSFAQALNECKLGPWTLNMTRAQVIAQSEQGPYVPVKATDGLETFNAKLDGKKENVSFVFDDDKVKYMQVFKYEGPDYADAKAAALDVFQLFSSQFGGATVHGVSIDGRKELTVDAFTAFIEKTLGSSIEMGEKMKKEQAATMLVTFDMKPVTQPQYCRLHSQLIYHSRTKTFYVLMFQDAPGAPDRTKANGIEVTPF